MNLLNNINYKYILWCTSVILSIVVFIVMMGVSIAHLFLYWTISNPDKYSYIISFIIPLATLSALIALVFEKKARWSIALFSVVFLFELIGNIYFCYSHIDITSKEYYNFYNMYMTLYESFRDTTLDITLTGTQLESAQLKRDALFKSYIAVISGAFVPIVHFITFKIISLLVKLKIDKHVKNQVASDGQDIEDDVHIENINLDEKELNKNTPLKKNLNNNGIQNILLSVKRHLKEKNKKNKQTPFTPKTKTKKKAKNVKSIWENPKQT